MGMVHCRYRHEGPDQKDLTLIGNYKEATRRMHLRTSLLVASSKF